jgi:hypothetical protein
MAKKLKKLLARITALEKAIAGMLSGKKPARKKTKRKKATKAIAKKANKAPRKTKSPAKARKPIRALHTGMMGDGTEEQNLGQRGNPGARIGKGEVSAAFATVRK